MPHNNRIDGDAVSRARHASRSLGPIRKFGQIYDSAIVSLIRINTPAAKVSAIHL